MSLVGAVCRNVLRRRPLRRIRQLQEFSTMTTTKDFVVSSSVPDVHIPDVPVHEYVWSNFDRWHDKIAVECVETSKRYTYADIHRMAHNLAGFLQKNGLGKGDTAAIVLPNVPEYFVALLGIMQAGLTITTINPIYTSDEIKKQLMSANARMVFTMTDLFPTVNTAVNCIPNVKVPIVTINYTQQQTNPAGTIKFEETCSTRYDIKDPRWEPNDVVLLPYSSGTTGLPKGVQLTHKNLVANYKLTSVPEFKLNVDTHGDVQDVVPIILPMFHMYGLGVVGLSMFAQGVKFTTLAKFNTQLFSKLLHQYDPTLLYIVPPIILMMLNNPEFEIEKNRSLRSVVSAAAPLGAADINRFQDRTSDRIHLLQIYGMTECAPLSHHQSFLLKDGIKIGGSGIALPNTHCKIVNVDDPDCIGLGPNTSGELLIKGPQVMKGYYNNDKANKDIFVGDGWLRTGDIAHYDEDGHFFITDRLKELIKVKGFQVAPAELEELLRDHPDVKDAAVIGVPDERSGEVPKAFIVFRDTSKSSIEDLHKYVAEKVVKYKQLTGGIVVLDQIPKTASGKILRRELKKM
ncbi:PREDICTED: 4-coumarate--CoA ligase 1-like [Nicrophorus vespilloides]|uniref:4-coumarate--CoA ligase 1-like n=1 Tax=Nicrophorus vespilloides TaxID=110193 RepID=A0ABM1NKB1_NICVS|nr:PREDICTED: 4-coumarate--CoA ligase 1-like [Nicrophorus vespilloides]